MKPQIYRNTVMVAAAIAASCIATPATAQISPSDPLCRRVVNPPQGLAIRRNASTGATQVGGVGVNERLLLTTNPATTSKDASGRTWVQVASPAAGWVSNGFGLPTNLALCAGGPTPPPPPPPSRCRRVINPPEGLVIRRDANLSSPSVGGIGLNGRMTVTTAPPTTSRDSAGRTWVEIEAPAKGWVSNGFGGQSNIGVCP